MELFGNPFTSNTINNNGNNNLQSIQELQAKLEMIRQQQAQSNLNPNQKIGGAFGKLQDFIQNTDKNKVNFANNDETVIEKYNTMKDVFVLFMLENSRPQFESWCNQRNINVINDYVDSFIAKTKEYVEPSVKQDSEIEMLKKQIQILQEQLMKNSNKDVI